MPLEKLSNQELSTHVSGRGAPEEYVNFLNGLRVGQGGRAVVSKEGVSRQSVKNRLIRAAESVGLELKFRRSPAETVVFEVTGRK